MRADLDTLLIAVYCAACSLFPAVRAEATARAAAEDHRQRADLPDGGADAARDPERAPLPADRRLAAHASLPAAAFAVDLQRALPRARAQAGHPLARDRLRASGLPRLAASARHHPASLRPEHRYRQPLRTRSLLRLRLLARPFALLLGHAPCAPLGPRRRDRRLRPRPRRHARAGGGARPARAPAAQRAAGALRQRLRRARVRAGGGELQALSSAPAAPTSPIVPSRRSAGSASASSRSCRRSRTRSASSVTWQRPPPASRPASSPASSPSPPPSISTGSSASRHENSSGTGINRSNI